MILPSVREQPLCFSPHIELDLPSNWVWQQGNNRINTRSCAMAWSRPKWNRTKKLAPPLFLWHFHDTTDCPTVCELVALQGRWQGLFAWCRLYSYPCNLMRPISWIKNIVAVNIFITSVNNSLHIQQSSWIWICEAYKLCHKSMDKTHNIFVNQWIWF